MSSLELLDSDLLPDSGFLWSRDSSLVTDSGLTLVGAGDNCLKTFSLDY